MVISANIVTKSGEKRKRKRIDTLTQLLTMLAYCICGLCAFPNMAINANIAGNLGGKRQKNRLDVNC